MPYPVSTPASVYDFSMPPWRFALTYPAGLQARLDWCRPFWLGTKCSCTAWILVMRVLIFKMWHSPAIHHNKQYPSIPAPIHARIFLSNPCASHARPTSCDRPVLARLLTSNHAFNHETPWATRTLFGGSGRFPSSLCIPTYSHLSQ